jgi:hypothetical protein
MPTTCSVRTPGSAAALASGSGDAQLNAALGVVTTDTTALEFQFQLAEAGTVYLDYVFASDEYNVSAIAARCVRHPGPTAGQQCLDQLCFGARDEPTRYRRRRSTAPPTRSYYKNNDPRDAGRYQREFGYNGFTDVFQAAIPLPAGTHQIKFAISDVGDQDGDSAVFIGAGSFSTQPSVRPQGIVGIQHDGFGDRNVFRDQGQTLIHSNTILYAADWGIMSDAGARDTQATTAQYLLRFPRGSVRLTWPRRGICAS